MSQLTFAPLQEPTRISQNYFHYLSLFTWSFSSFRGVVGCLTQFWLDSVNLGAADVQSCTKYFGPSLKVMYASRTQIR